MFDLFSNGWDAPQCGHPMSIPPSFPTLTSVEITYVVFAILLNSQLLQTSQTVHTHARLLHSDLSLRGFLFAVSPFQTVQVRVLDVSPHLKFLSALPFHSPIVHLVCVHTTPRNEPLRSMSFCRLLCLIRRQILVFLILVVIHMHAVNKTPR